MFIPMQQDDRSNILRSGSSRSDHHLTLSLPQTHPKQHPIQIELESGCGGGGAEVQKKHSERWTEDLFGRGAWSGMEWKDQRALPWHGRGIMDRCLLRIWGGVCLLLRRPRSIVFGLGQMLIPPAHPPPDDDRPAVSLLPRQDPVALDR